MAYIGKVTNKNELKLATGRVLSQLNNTIVNNLNLKTASVLLYWLEQWGREYIPNESKFNYNSLKYYKRGSVVQANFGFKVGSEQGGLHYAIVVENENSKTNRTVTVIPLRSLEMDEDPNEIDDKHEVFLGYGIFKNEIKKLKGSISLDEVELEKYKPEDKEYSKIEKKLNKSIRKMKNFEKGSVAVVSQICALSKMRIYTPKYENDELSDFILDNKQLDKIDEKIKMLYLRRKPIKEQETYNIQPKSIEENSKELEKV